MGTRDSLTAVILVAALAAACGGSNNSPTAPSGSAAPPVSTDNTSAHYVSAAQGNQPALDMVLFFTVSTSTSSVTGASRISLQAATAFSVTGSYNTGAGGFTGTVTGTLSGAPTSGTFTGVLTANLTNGCVASKNYSGTLTTSTLDWMPGSDITDCNGTNPLTFSVSTQAVAPSPVTATTGTYRGQFSVPVVLVEGGPCRRIDTNSGTLNLTLTIANDGTVTGTGYAIGTEMISATIGPSSCGSQPGGTSPYGTENDQVAGTTSNFGFIDSNTVQISGGTAVFGARFFGALSGNTITGVFTNSENIHNTSAVGCTGDGHDCAGTGSSTVTLTRQ
jgi:hypothetical protein